MQYPFSVVMKMILLYIHRKKFLCLFIYLFVLMRFSLKKKHFYSDIFFVLHIFIFFIKLINCIIWMRMNLQTIGLLQILLLITVLS